MNTVKSKILLSNKNNLKCCLKNINILKNNNEVILLIIIINKILIIHEKFCWMYNKYYQNINYHINKILNYE